MIIGSREIPVPVGSWLALLVLLLPLPLHQGGALPLLAPRDPRQQDDDGPQDRRARRYGDPPSPPGVLSPELPLELLQAPPGGGLDRSHKRDATGPLLEDPSRDVGPM